MDECFIAVEKVLVDLKPHFTKDKLLVSIAAGVTIQNLQVLPNHPKYYSVFWVALASGFFY